MKVVITGATGNVGTSLIEVLSAHPAIHEIVGLARRGSDLPFEKTTLVNADVARDELRSHFEGADAVVHLAWLIQPERDEEALERVNVEGSRRVFEAAVSVGVPAIIHASSFAVYAAGPKDRPVEEAWSTAGIPSSLYSRQKVRVERQLDELEKENRSTRIVRMRTALVLKRAAASELHRNFLGRLVPPWLFRKKLVAVVPDVSQLRVQAVHGVDAGRAYRQALLTDVRGPFNIAADPVLDADAIARLLNARKLRVKAKTLRRLIAASYRLRFQPTSPGLFDMVLQTPLMDARRAREELDWKPQYTATESFLEVLNGIRERAGMRTAPLEPSHQAP